MSRTVSALLIVAFSLAFTIPLPADLLAVGFDHTCAVDNGVNSNSADAVAPSSPYTHYHLVQLGDWSCSSWHSATFNSTQGAMSLHDGIQARDIGDDTSARGTGGFNFRNTTDLFVTYSATMGFSLPGNGSEASLTLAAISFPGFNVVWSDADGLITNDPVSDKAQISGSFIMPALPAGSFYSLAMGMSLYTSGDFPGTRNLLTAQGDMSLSFGPVPEPATICCLIVPIAMLRRKSARPTSRPPVAFGLLHLPARRAKTSLKG